MRPTVILTDQRLDQHTWPGHVEQAARLQAVRAAIDAAGFGRRLVQLAPRPVPETALETVHSPQLLRRVRQLASYGGGQFDPDTYVTADSWDAATLAAGAALDAVEAVAGSSSDHAFALVRPPGHHATPDRAMGFCLINNVAVAARYAVNALGLARVAVVDYDVHHGNGTQDIFYDDPQVLFVSTHAAPFYPGTGAFAETGGPNAPGATLNLPMPYGVGDQGYAQIFTQLVAPALRRFRPELILVSAGFDAHWGDPLGPMLLSVSGYAQLTAALIDVADELCGGKIVFVLEGGYNLDALAACVVSSLQLLTGQAPAIDRLGNVEASEPLEQVERLIAAASARHPLLS
jgi:acetoin utilization deacetylase AcuC-like enzyme